MKRPILLNVILLLLGSLLIVANSCKKDVPDEPDVPVLSTTEVTYITMTTAKSGGEITSDLGATVTSRGICWSTDPEPTISDHKTTDGSGAGLFTSSLSGLLPGSTYYVRSYATNSNGTGYGSAISFTTQKAPLGSFTDPRDGSVYRTVTIGNQIWMAENLKYLPSVVTPVTGSQTTPYYYVYGYYGTDVVAAKATANYNTYGVLYNWCAAMDGALSSVTNPSNVQGVCPSGWHLPSNAEWAELIDHLDGNSLAGSKLKDTGTTHWYEPNVATNESGFTALPGGYSSYTEGFYNSARSIGCWYATDEDIMPILAWTVCFVHHTGYAYTDPYSKEMGFSVRCIKD